jgi:hypothetical protein
VAKGRGLATLSITNCKLTTAKLKLLMPGLCMNRSLIILNLANNELDDGCGTILGKIISTQGFLKDEIIWLTALRNEVPKTNLNKVGSACSEQELTR